MDKMFLFASLDNKRSVEYAEPGTPIRFIASTEGIKRDGKELNTNRWRLENYQRNPVVLWAHDYMGRNLPIGRAGVVVMNRSLVADVTFDQEDEFARSVERKYRRGFLNAVSVGWNDVMEGKDVYHELLDISGVPVPGDPDALMERAFRNGLGARYGLAPGMSASDVKLAMKIRGILEQALLNYAAAEKRKEDQKVLSMFLPHRVQPARTRGKRKLRYP